MTVYIAPETASFHMSTDGDLEELHQFARHIGVPRARFRDRPGLPYYDVTPGRRILALRAGAVEVNDEDFIAYCRRPLKARER